MATQQNKSANKTDTKGTSQASRLSPQELEAQDRYWRGQFQDEPYYSQGRTFDAYEPAYRLGVEARNANQGKTFSEVESSLRSQYEADEQAQQRLDWSEARQAVQAAWDRSDQSMAGDNKHKAEQQRSRH
jgi:hypothetical protein